MAETQEEFRDRIVQTYRMSFHNGQPPAEWQEAHREWRKPYIDAAEAVYAQALRDYKDWVEGADQGEGIGFDICTFALTKRINLEEESDGRNKGPASCGAA